MASHNSKRRRKREDYRNAHRDTVVTALPQKRLYRQRAHANPYSDHHLDYPSSPELMNWGDFFPSLEATDGGEVAATSSDVTIADIGCGFGGLLIALSPQFPQELIIGMELRQQVADYVQDKIKALRNQHSEDGLYQNIACIRANTMKFLPNFFKKAQLKKIFFCFPDPHFKARKHKARIVSQTLNSEYAYALRPQGIVYTITDVEDLHNWMVEHFTAHPSFEPIPLSELEEDPCVRFIRDDTEEAKKVERNNGHKYIACFRRIEDPPWPE